MQKIVNTELTNTEAVNPSDVLEMATWNRQRSTDELLSFITSRHDNLADVELGL